MGICYCTEDIQEHWLQVETLVCREIKAHLSIKQDKLKSLPFKGLQSRLVTATVLQYTGYKEDVLPMMQKLSESSRAFIYNASGLKGFLIAANVH